MVRFLRFGYITYKIKRLTGKISYNSKISYKDKDNYKT